LIVASDDASAGIGLSALPSQHSSAYTSGVNAYLRAGWIMLAAHTVGIAERDGQQLVYSVAWLRANGEPVHPEFKTQMEEWLEKYEAEDA